ncbi:hypothetical protein H0W91_01430 [Patescibacteria group bacterium]|nr:hypothetical protein [Patescibacteria group bacterium]
MKSKITPVLLTALLASTGMFSVVSAQVSTGTLHTNVDVELNSKSNDTTLHTDVEEADDNDSNSEKTEMHRNATSTGAKKDLENDNADENDNEELTEESHHSAVSAIVKVLLAVANREGGIGQQVRVVAMAQQNSASTSDKAIIKIKNKEGISAFLFGSDFHSLGELRSEMVTTEHNIDQLKKLLVATSSVSTKADLSAQIKALEDLQTKIDVFAEAHENSFSVFGWFTKWFSK